MNPKTQLILCVLAFFVNALKEKHPLLIVVLLDHSAPDLMEHSLHMRQMSKLLHGRIAVPVDPTIESITHQLSTGKSLHENVLPIWISNGGNALCVNWPDTDHIYGGRHCHQSYHPEATIGLPFYINHVIQGFRDNTINLAMIYMQNHKKGDLIGFEIASIMDLLDQFHLSARTSVFVIFAHEGTVQDKGSYYAFGRGINHEAPGYDRNFLDFHGIFCILLGINVHG